MKSHSRGNSHFFSNFNTSLFFENITFDLILLPEYKSTILNSVILCVKKNKKVNVKLSRSYKCVKHKKEFIIDKNTCLNKFHNECINYFSD